MKSWMALTLAVSMMAGVAVAVSAQQTGPTSPEPAGPAQRPGAPGAGDPQPGSGAGAGGGALIGGGAPMTIDCPPGAVLGSPDPSSTAGRGSLPSASPGAPRDAASPPPGGGAGTMGRESSPSTSAGAGKYGASPSGGPGMGGATAAQRVEGEIKNLDASGRSFEVQNVKLEVEANTAILVDCKRASLTELKEGTRIKAAYEVKDGRNLATVIEAER